MSVWSVPLGRIDYAGTFGEARYKAQIHFATTGLFSSFWKSSVDNMAAGRIGAASLLPETYTSQSLSHSGERQFVRVTYPAAGAPVLFADPPYDLSHDPVTAKQKQGAVDPVTAISSIIAELPNGSLAACNRSLAVFDGRRRYDIVFAPLPADSGMKQEAGSGTICQARYQRIAGLKQDLVDVSDPPPIYVEFVQVSAANSARRYTVARRLWASFWWGRVLATLTAATADGQSLLTRE